MFRPCIDLHEGKVKQIVGGTLSNDPSAVRTNFVSERPASWYAELLQDQSGIVAPCVPPGIEPVFHLYVVQVPNRDAVQAAMKRAGVETGIHYPIPLHEQPAYARFGYKPEDFPVAHRLGPAILSLPMFPEMTRAQAEYVVDALKSAVAA